MSLAPTASSLEPSGEIVLRRREERRISDGHAWVFSNEIERTEGSPEAGGVVSVHRSDGRILGFALYNPHSLIAARLFSRTRGSLGADLLQERLRAAASLRDRIFPGRPAYRLVHGESDGLPGLVIDRYGESFCLQTLSLGMDRLKGTICEALGAVFGARTVVERNESALRRLEGLPRISGILRGSLAGEVEIEEGDLKFRLDLLKGHKTGFYFDQRENRLALRRYVQAGRALDLYCNEGAFGLHVARAGAAGVLGVDSSGDAVERAGRHAAANGLSSACRFERGDVPDALSALHAAGERFDLVVLDPPSFTRSRKNVASARRTYTDVNRKAIRVLARGGILATASCSHHITGETFLAAVAAAAGSIGRRLLLLEWRSQGPDHPVLPAMPETRYLKFGVFRVD